MQVVVHIGSPKCGSSALQWALKQNRVALSGYGLHVHLPPPPGARGLSTIFEAEERRAVPALRRHFPDMAAARDWSEACWQAFEAEVAREKPPVVILSSEHFIDLRHRAAFLDRLRGMFRQITLVAYVRDPVSLFVSDIDQQIRGGTRLADLYVPKGFMFDVPGQIRKYATLLGPESLILRNFARSNLTGGDVVTDFHAILSRITGRQIDLPGSDTQANESLAAAATVWLLAMNEDFDRFGDGGPADRARLERRHALIARLRQDPALRALPRLRLSGGLLETVIRSRTRGDCLWLNETFLVGQEQLPVAETVAPPPGREAVREALRDWLLSFMSPDTLAPLMAAFLPLETAAEVRPGRGAGAVMRPPCVSRHRSA